MSNGKVMIIRLIAALITKTLYTNYSTLLNHTTLLMETLMLKLIYLIMQQKQI